MTGPGDLAIGQYFGTTARFWLGLQEDHDLEEQLSANVAEIERIQPCPALSEERES